MDGIIRDASTAKPISNAKILIEDECGETREEVFTNKEGYWCVSDYDKGAMEVLITASGYCDRKIAVVNLPEVVRLMNTDPAIYTSSLETIAGGNINVAVHAPDGASLYIICTHPKKDSERSQYLTTLEPCVQVSRDSDVVEYGMSWPFKNVEIPLGLRSGLYSLTVISPDGKKAHAPIIIRCCMGKPSVLVLASTATWACYNVWGGRNRYRNYENSPSNEFEISVQRSVSKRRSMFSMISSRISETWRVRINRLLGRDRTRSGWMSKPLHFHRPWFEGLGLDVPPSQRCLNHLCALETKTLAWLDREGLDFEYAADTSLQDEEGILTNRKAVVLIGHSEYWSVEMFENLRMAHTTKGLWVLNFSGNSMYREIEYSRDECSLRLKNILFRLSGYDETLVVGARYAEKAYGIAEPFRVVLPSHWIFENVGIARGATFGSECLVDSTVSSETFYSPERPTTNDGQLRGVGAAGFEVDRVSKTGRKRFKVVAESVSGTGAQMCIKDPSGSEGGSVSMSSITFGGSLLVDPVCSRIARESMERAIE